MGDFIIRIDATGGHGCQREKGNGEVVDGCGEPGCPDCIARQTVKRLQETGTHVNVASLTHWPAEKGCEPAGEVRDDLITHVRRGKF